MWSVNECDSLISLHEAKLDDCTDALVMDTMGYGFDFFALPATHTCGGILLAWHSDIWNLFMLNDRA